MKHFKNVFDLYINSSIHVSFAVVAFTVITCLESGLKLNFYLLGFVFFATVSGYNFVKYAGIAKLHHLSLAKNLRIIQIFSLLSFFALLYLIFQLDRQVLIASMILGVLTLLYAVPVLGSQKNLRSLPGLKIFIIALVWAGSTVLLPYIDNEAIIQKTVIVDFIQRFMLVVVLTLPFEIRDLKYDENQLGTIPQRLGVGMTRVFGTGLLLIIFIAELFQEQVNATIFIAQAVILLVAGAFLWFSKKDQSNYFASFWVEAVPVFYLAVLWIFTHFLPHVLL